MATTDEALALAVQYRERGDLQLAEQLCCQILQTDPHHPDALYELGMIAYRVGRPDQAAFHLGRAVSLRPGAAAFHCHLGMAYRALGRLEEAVACNRQALRLQPDFVEAHNNLGIAYRALGRLDEATACYEQAVRYQPDYAGTHNNLGAAYQAVGRLDEALGCFREALRLQPRFAAAHVNMGVALLAQGKPAEAVASLREGLRLLPNYAAAHLNLGLALQATGKPEEALACFEQAVRLEPRFAEAHLAIASARLLAGDFERGWPQYELRLRCPQFVVPRLPSSHPAWDGSPLEGRTVLVRAEQGLGDTIQFIRYARCLQQLGGRVIAEVQPRLLPLLQSCLGIDQFIAQGETLPPFDVHAFLLSLPKLFGTNLTNLPADVPYLAADPTLVAHWRKELSALEGFKIGIAWQGNPTVKLDFLRSFPLSEFAPLSEVEGVRLVSLQKGPGSEQLSALGDRFAVLDLGSRLDETSGAFMDTAAVLMNLDLVVTVDTALAHLAGALGVPVWVALGTNPDWRFFLGRADSPWYPTMRLFRQREPCRWSEVFEGIAGQVRKLVAETHANLGIVQRQHGKLAEALTHGPQAVQLEPRFAGDHYRLGFGYHVAGKLDEARACYERAIALQPTFAEAHHNLGNVLQEQGRAAEAEAYHREAVRLRPDLARMHCNLGAALAEQDKLTEAAASFQQAIDLQPVLVDAHCRLGEVYFKQGRLDNAVASFEEALRLEPDHAVAHNALGIVLENQGKLEAALASLEKAVRCKPDHALAHYNLGWHLLLEGNLERGWSEYEWRWKNKALPPPALSHPRWDGGPLHGKTILLYAEQGLGDTLQFIRYAPLVQARGGRVVVACQPDLVEILTRCSGIDQLVAGTTGLPDFDVQAPLLSLPGLCGTTLANIPAKIPYLMADADCVDRCRDRLAVLPGFKVGICWQGRPTHLHDRRRSAPLGQFAPLAEVEGVHLIGLQKGPGAEQLGTLAECFRVTDLGSEWVTFMDTAAILMNLDLVVTVDTALAHLAGALGVPVWVALPFVPDWRWLLKREDSPWYPSMRLFRQAHPGQWPEVFERIAGEVRKLVAETP